MPTKDLPIIQKTYDLIKWYLPILNRLPRDHKFQIGDRIAGVLFDFLETLIVVRYEREKLPQLQAMNGKLDILRYHTRLLLDLELFSAQRYAFAAELLNSIGTDLGRWVQYQTKHKGITDGDPEEFAL
jgi:hypothetical protein